MTTHPPGSLLSRLRLRTGPAGPPALDRRLVAPLVLGSILNPVNSSMIAVALIPIGVALHASPSRTVLLVSSLYLATAVGQPVVGRLVDLHGPRRLYLAGTALVGVAGLLGALAPNLGVLILARMLLGFGTCAGYPAAMHLIRSEAARTGQDRPGGILTVLAVCGQTVAVIGPTLGGLLIELGGWRSIFAVNVPLAALCLALGARRLPRPRPAGPGPDSGPGLDPDPSSGLDPDSGPGLDPSPGLGPNPNPTPGSGPGDGAGGRRRVSLDAVGMLLFTATLTTLLLFLLEPRAGRWYLPVLAAVAGAGLAARELRVAEPFIDLRVFAGNLPLLATYGRTLLTQSTFYAFMYGYTQWLEAGRGLGAATAGLVLLPVFLTGIIVTSGTGGRSGLRGRLLLGAAGQVVTAAALLAAGTGSPVWLLVLVSIVVGTPLGLNGVANQTALYRQAAPARMGSSAGLLRTFTYLGAMTASAATAAVFRHRVDTAGLHHLALFMLGCAGALVVLTGLDRSLAAAGPDPAGQPADRPDSARSYPAGQPAVGPDPARSHTVGPDPARSHTVGTGRPSGRTPPITPEGTRR